MIQPTGMIDCEDALARLWEFLDGELDAADEAAVKRHLDLCGRCFPQYDFQRAYFELTRRVRQREHAPPALRSRLFRMLLEQDAAEGGAR